MPNCLPQAGTTTYKELRTNNQEPNTGYNWKDDESRALDFGMLYGPSDWRVSQAAKRPAIGVRCPATSGELGGVRGGFRHVGHRRAGTARGDNTYERSPSPHPAAAVEVTKATTERSCCRTSYGPGGAFFGRTAAARACRQRRGTGPPDDRHHTETFVPAHRRV